MPPSSAALGLVRPLLAADKTVDKSQDDDDNLRKRKRTSQIDDTASEDPEETGVVTIVNMGSTKMTESQRDSSAAPQSAGNYTSPVTRRPVGLVNLGNTCYVNSVVQVLFHIKPFRKSVLQWRDPDSDPSPAGAAENSKDKTATQRSPGKDSEEYAKEMMRRLQDLFINMVQARNKGQGRFSPSDFINWMRSTTHPNFCTLGQQDAQEFLRFLIDNVNEACEMSLSKVEENNAKDSVPVRKRKRSAISNDDLTGDDTNNTARTEENSEKTMEPPKKRQRADHANASGNDSLDVCTDVTIASYLFEGESVIATKCLECEVKSSHPEKFLDLSLPVDIGHSLTWALNTEGKHELMRGENKYACAECRAHVEAERWWQLRKIPPVLTIHLKLFSFPESRISGAKVQSAMSCPSKMKFKRWASDNCEQADSEYWLDSVIVHQGAGVGSGHYYSYIALDDDSYADMTAPDVQANGYRVDTTCNGTKANTTPSEVGSSGTHSEKSRAEIDGFGPPEALEDREKEVGQFEQITRRWFCFDDQEVMEVSEHSMREELFTCQKSKRTAYLLFYSRRDRNEDC